MPGSAMDATAVLDAVEAARLAWHPYQQTVNGLKGALRASDLPGLAFELQRIAAYDALAGGDEGMGQSMDGWLDEIEQAAREAMA